jgi:hypothetical protein
MKMHLVVKYIYFYSTIIHLIKTTLWQGVIKQNYAEQFYSEFYRIEGRRPLALALDGDIYA